MRQQQDGELYNFAHQASTWRSLHPCPTHLAPLPQQSDLRGSICHGRRNVTFVLAPREATFARLALAMCLNQDNHADWLTDEDVANMIAQCINKMIVAFTRAGCCVDISGNIRGTSTCRIIAQNRIAGSFTGRSAICDYPMWTGAHYISMTVGQSTVMSDRSRLSQHHGMHSGPKGMAIGVISAEYDPCGPHEVSTHVGTTSKTGAWLYAPVNGNLIHGNRGLSWSGQRPAVLGDTIGLLLDLEKGSLDVWKNGEWLGQMVNCSPALRRRLPDYAEHSPDKVQPLHWCCDLGWEASSLEIIRWHK